MYPHDARTHFWLYRADYLVFSFLASTFDVAFECWRSIPHNNNSESDGLSFLYIKMAHKSGRLCTSAQDCFPKF